MKRKGRGAYFIHPSSQLRYIAMTVLPTFLMSIFCIYFLFASGERIMKNERQKLVNEAAVLRDASERLNEAQYTPQTVKKIESFKKDIHLLQYNLEKQYYKDLQDWIDVKLTLLIVIPFILMCIGIMALLYSNRICGPLSRMGKYMDMLRDGKRVPTLAFRKYDEFKEVGEAFERLKKKLEEQGFIHD